MPVKKMKEPFLLEIGTEEIPARFLPDAAKTLRSVMLKLLKDHRISFDESHVETLFTPRRLTVFVPEMRLMQDDCVDCIKGPPVSVAIGPDGDWTKAATSFAEKQGIAPGELIRQKTEKGEYIFVEKKIKGRSSISVLQESLPEAILKIKFPKSMRWGSGTIFFARPIRWVVALLGTKVVRFKLGSLTSADISFGYRWVKNPKIKIPRADLNLYKKLLKSKSVYADFAERMDLIKSSIDKTLGFLQSIHDSDQSLLEEVTNLVESPYVGEGNFDKKFLSIPAEVLSIVVKYHQKYLPVYESGTDRLLPKFIVVFNGHIGNKNSVIHGNERVLRARLADAAFFWEQDQKRTLADLIPDLKNVVFQEDLGTYYDKSHRLKSLAEFVGAKMSLSSETRASFERSAILCKADLVTQMVNEFTSLQGVIGGEYALIHQEGKEVSTAIREHYWPLSGSEGELPRTLCGNLLSLIDKIDTVAGIYHAGFSPTGSQDPYGLRRLSSGILRILYEKGLDLSLKECIQKSLSIYGFKNDILETVLRFFQERLENLFIALGFPYDLTRAVVERQSDRPARAYKILKDLAKIQKESFFAHAVTVVERTSNILKGQSVREGGVEESLLKDKEEIELYRVYQSNYHNVVKFTEAGDFVQATSEYARIFYEPVHVLFDKVLINVKEEPIRQNRFVLLKLIHELYAAQVADLSKVANPALAKIS